MNYHITLSFCIRLFCFKGGSFPLTLENTPKIQKVRNDPLLDNKIFKRRAPIIIKDDFFEDLYFD